jgi:hypothetical protein
LHCLNLHCICVLHRNSSKQTRGIMNLRRNIFLVWCTLCLWLAASSGTSRPLVSLHEQCKPTSEYRLYSNHLYSSSTSHVTSDSLNTVSFLNFSPDTFGDVCEETEETKAEDILESEHTSIRLCTQTLEPSSLLPSIPTHGRLALALYILHHNWKHYLSAAN